MKLLIDHGADPTQKYIDEYYEIELSIVDGLVLKNGGKYALNHEELCKGSI